MRKLISGLLLLFGCSSSVMAQQPKWYLESDRIDFSTAIPGVSNQFSINSGPVFPSNEGYNKYIQPVVTVAGGELDILPPATLQFSTYSREVSVVCVPGQCNMWYVIGIDTRGNNLILKYATISGLIDRRLIGPVVEAGVIGDITSCNGLGKGGIAIGKYNATTKSRVLFTVAPSSIQTATSFLNRFEITANGITQLGTFNSMVNIFGPQYNNITTNTSELELFETPSGSARLCWADYTTPCVTATTANHFFYIDFTNNGTGSIAGTGSLASIPNRVTGLELFDNGNKALISTADPATGAGQLYTVDLANDITTAIPNSADYGGSQIERAVNGFYYACGRHGTGSAATYDLAAIDIATGAMMPASTNGAIIPIHGWRNTLPDQVDNEVYDVDANGTNDVVAYDDNLDIGSEPNLRSATVNQSPDLWNIRSATTGNVNQHADPVIFYSDETPVNERYNILRLRVRNTGCSQTPVSYAKLYWSVKGTTETWPGGWSGTINGQPKANEITEVYAGPRAQLLNPFFGHTNVYIPGQGFQIPALNANETYIINAQWKAVDPTQYATGSIPAGAEISFLGRILEQGAAPVSEQAGVLAAVNAKNSNDVVMRVAHLGVPGNLMAHDNAADAGAEPYVPAAQNWDVWKSPDLWNRAHNDANGNMTPEDPDYSVSPVYPDPTPLTNPAKYNVVRFRVKNMGNEVSAPSHAKVYWTAGTTAGEVWPYAWKAGLGQGAPYFLNNTTQQVGDEIKLNYTGTLLETGTGINTAATGAYEYDNTGNELGFPVPSLKAGEEYIINAKWQPLNPTPFNSLVLDANGQQIINPMICLLGRIVDPVHDPMKLEHSPNTPANPFKDNVKNNNNVVTRNAILVSLNPPVFNRRVGGGTIFVGNHLSNAALATIRINQVNEAISLPFEENCSATIMLDAVLWEKWDAGGRVASGVTVADEDRHTLTLTTMEGAELSNIALEAYEYHQLGLTFAVNTAIAEPENYDFTVTQELMNLENSGIDNSGNACHFLVALNGSDADKESTECFEDAPVAHLRGTAGTQNGAGNAKDKIMIWPNPANNSVHIDLNMQQESKVTIRINDLNGSLVKTVKNDADYKAGSARIDVRTDDLAPGIYFIVSKAGGIQQMNKVVIIH